MEATVRSLLIAGERREGAVVEDAAATPAAGEVALAYGLLAGDAPRGWTALGRAPLVERPLRLSRLAARLPGAARALLPEVPLLAPFGRRPRAGFRDISATPDPRVSRLWGRFSVDVRVAVERDARFFERRVWGRPDAGYRVFIVEDGDRYAIRAMCVFTVREEGGARAGYVMDLLHDRSVDGMRGASHLLGLALRAMSDDGAEVARACSLPHSGSFPLLLRHAFVPSPASGRRFAVRSLDPALDDVVTQRDLWYLSYVDLEEV
jgi:hypothetical protein